MAGEIIPVTTEDNHFQHVEVIKRNREKRHRHGKFFVEGVSSINLALEHGWTFDTLVFSSAKVQSDWAKEVVGRARAKTLLDLTPSLLEKLSDKEDSSEVLALLQIPQRSLANLKPSPTGLVVLFDRPSSPGNLGTLIRSADAFGADAIVISGHAVDPFDTQVIRASVGTFFVRPVISIPSPQDFKAWLDSAAAAGIPYTTVGTSAKAEAQCFDVSLRRPLVLLLGNEATGLSKGYKEMSELMVKIPITGTASSLNVSCAASIFLYELARQEN